MAETYITRIRTADGDKQIDYNALANLPKNTYSESQVLSSETKAALGLSASATPDDAFKALNTSLESKAGFVVSEAEPASTQMLWIDPVNGLKYHNGTEWVSVPVAYT